MITTTRRSFETANVYEHRGAGVDLLERPRAYEEYNHAPIMDNLQEAEERRKNLDRLLNYDRYSAQTESVKAEEVVDSVVAEPVAFSDEDIRPTSTTMQFGEDIDNIREEMSAAREEEKTDFRLNSKGKLVVVLYSLVVTVILALIILNTGVLANLSGIRAAKAQELTSIMQEYDALSAEIDSISSSEHVANVAENDYGMIKD